MSTPAEISIVIDTANDAFFENGEHSPTREVVRMLRELTQRIENGALLNCGDNVQLYDSNGNDVGYAAAK